MKEWIGVIAGSSGDSITEALQKRGYSVALVAGSQNENGTENADAVGILDLREKGKILEFFKKNDVHKIVLGTGHVLAIQLVAYLESKGMSVSIDTNAAICAKNKAEYKNALLKSGFKTPKFIVIYKEGGAYDIEEVKSYVGFPCVIKSLVDKVNPQKINNEFELKNAINEILLVDDVLIEEYVYGIDYTIAVTNDGQVARAHSVVYYSKALEVGLKGFTETQRDKLSEEKELEVRRLAENVVTKTGLLGLPRVDLITTPNGEHFILETNAVTVVGLNTHQKEFLNGVLKVAKESYVDLLVDEALSILKKRNTKVTP